LLRSHDWLEAETEITFLATLSNAHSITAHSWNGCFHRLPGMKLGSQNSSLYDLKRQIPSHIPWEPGSVCKAEAQRKLFFSPTWPLMFFAHAWGSRTNNNNDGMSLHINIWLLTAWDVLSARGQNNGVKIYRQGAEPVSAGWQLKADRWPGTRRSPVFTLMNVCGIPGLHHYSELCGFW